MTDIVELLRALARHEHDDLSIGDEAADEIERLRVEVNRAGFARKCLEGEIERLRADNSQLAAGGISRTTVYTIMYEENKQLRDEIGRLRAERQDWKLLAEDLGKARDLDKTEIEQQRAADYFPVEGAPPAFKPPGTTKRK